MKDKKYSQLEKYNQMIEDLSEHKTRTDKCIANFKKIMKVLPPNSQRRIAECIFSKLFDEWLDIKMTIEGEKQKFIAYADTLPKKPRPNTIYFIKTCNGKTLEKGRHIIETDKNSKSQYMGWVDKKLVNLIHNDLQKG